eukprot:gene13695-16185_t
MRQSLQKQEQHITGFQTQLRTQLRTQRAKPSQTAHAADSTQKAADLAAQLKAQRDETERENAGSIRFSEDPLENLMPAAFSPFHELLPSLAVTTTRHKGENISTALAGSNLKESAPKCSGLLQTRLAAIGAPTRAGALGGLDVRLGPFTSSSRTRRRAGPGADGKAKLQPDGKHRSINELGSTRSPEFWELLLQKLSRGEDMQAAGTLEAGVSREWRAGLPRDAATERVYDSSVGVPRTGDAPEAKAGWNGTVETAQAVSAGSESGMEHVMDLMGDVRPETGRVPFSPVWDELDMPVHVHRRVALRDSVDVAECPEATTCAPLRPDIRDNLCARVSSEMLEVMGTAVAQWQRFMRYLQETRVPRCPR